MPKLMRITTVPGTLQSFCRGFLRELSRDYDLVAVSSETGGNGNLKTLGEEEGVRTVCVPMERQISPWKDLVSLLRMIRVMRRERPDIVHSMTPKAGLIGMVASWLAGVPVRIHTFTGLIWPTATGLRRRLLMATDRLTCACATHVIPEGEGVRQDLIRGGITKKPMKVLGYGNVRGIDLSHYDRTPEVMEAASALRRDGLFTFLFVGRVVADKGINELVAAFRELLQVQPDTRLVLVGRLEDDLDPISAESRQAIGTSDRILAAGETDDVRPWYAAADCFVFPSYREGFPNTVIEAGAMGLPSIVTDINGCNEIITSGINGIIVPPRDVRALYEAMLKMRTLDESRTRMASVARDRVASRFEQQFVRDCLKRYYREVFPESIGTSM